MSESHNPFSAAGRTGALPPAAAAARFASTVPAQQRPPPPPVDASSAQNPFTATAPGGSTATPSSGVQQNAGAAPAAPVVKTLAMLVADFSSVPGPSLVSDDGAPSPLMSPLHPLKLIRFISSAAPAASQLPPPVLTTAANAALPVLTEMIAAASAQQWSRVAASVPPFYELCTAAASVTPTILALSRLRVAALFSLRRWLPAVEETSAALAALVRAAAAVRASGDVADVATATCVWLLLHAESLRIAGLWREATFVAHAVLRSLRVRDAATAAATPRSVGAQSWVAPLSSASENSSGSGADVASATSGATVGADSVGVICDTAIDVIAQNAPSLSPQEAARLIVDAAGVISAALSGAGFALAAANAATDAAQATAALLRESTGVVAAGVGDSRVSEGGGGGNGASDGINGAVESPTLQSLAPSPGGSAAAVAAGVGAGDGAAAWARDGPPAWVSAGLALIAVSRTHRSVNRVAEARSALDALFNISPWRAAADLLLAAVAGSVATGDLAALSPATAYAVGVLGVVRGSEALAIGRAADALPLCEAAVVALSRRFLPPSVGALAGAAATAAAVSAASTLSRASHSCTAALGGASLLPARAPPANASLPRGYAPDPMDLLVEALVCAAEAVRRLPPGASAGVAATAAPPVTVATTLLEAAVRMHPCVILRAPLALTLTGLYDAGRDQMSASAAKRLIAAIAHSYGLNHLETSSFRISVPAT